MEEDGEEPEEEEGEEGVEGPVRDLLVPELIAGVVVWLQGQRFVAQVEREAEVEKEEMAVEKAATGVAQALARAEEATREAEEAAEAALQAEAITPQDNRLQVIPPTLLNLPAHPLHQKSFLLR